MTNFVVLGKHCCCRLNSSKHHKWWANKMLNAVRRQTKLASERHVSCHLFPLWGKLFPHQIYQSTSATSQTSSVKWFRKQLLQVITTEESSLFRWGNVFIRVEIFQWIEFSHLTSIVHFITNKIRHFSPQKIIWKLYHNMLRVLNCIWGNGLC